MNSLCLLVVSLIVVMLSAGCGVAVGGAAKPAPSPAPRSLTGQSVGHVLLGDRTLSRILKQSLNIDPRFPPRFGGDEDLQDDGTASPDDCLGVAAMLQRSVYRSSRVQEVAVETWRHAAMRADVTSVQEGVVSLPTAADADALFAAFARQWQECDGATTWLPGNMFRLKGKITNVQVATSVVAATVSIGWAPPNSKPVSDSESIPAGRAIGVRGNCLVEVEVDFFNSSNALGQGSGNFDTYGIDIARAMTDKVGALI
jgi:hypothetical protein